jgi:hypothetical protein
LEEAFDLSSDRLLMMMMEDVRPAVDTVVISPHMDTLCCVFNKPVT